MKSLFFLGLAVLALLSGCTTYQTYQSDMWGGKRLMGQGDWDKARETFTRAAADMPGEPDAYAFAATASYKMNDLPAASRFIEEAAKRDKQSDAHIRILGYRTLILLKEGKKKEGLQALSDYITAYQEEYGADNVMEARTMLRTGDVDLKDLQDIVDDQVLIFESDMEQFRSSGTGWFAAKYGAMIPNQRD